MYSTALARKKQSGRNPRRRNRNVCQGGIKMASFVFIAWFSFQNLYTNVTGPLFTFHHFRSLRRNRFYAGARRGYNGVHIHTHCYPDKQAREDRVMFKWTNSIRQRSDGKWINSFSSSSNISGRFLPKGNSVSPIALRGSG